MSVFSVLVFKVILSLVNEKVQAGTKNKNLQQFHRKKKLK